MTHAAITGPRCEVTIEELRQKLLLGIQYIAEVGRDLPGPTSEAEVDSFVDGLSEEQVNTYLETMEALQVLTPVIAMAISRMEYLRCTANNAAK